MELTINEKEFHLFQVFLDEECGMTLGDEKVYLVESRLSRLVMEAGCETYLAFIQKVKETPSLKAKVIDAMTTHETFWFRDEGLFHVFRDVLFPRFTEQIRLRQKTHIRIWCAACSTGQEPYSLAMMAHEFAKKGGGTELINGGLSIFATDISPFVVMLAKAGRYDRISMSRGMTPEYQERYFTEANNVWTLDESVRRMVKFDTLNLQDSFTPLGTFDVILLRNVAIYFSTAHKKTLLTKIHKTLAPDGYFFMGSSESVLGFSSDFHIREEGRYMYYQPKEPATQPGGKP